jgi:ribosomal protein S18 acetylase RimI-like enzyme
LIASVRPYRAEDRAAVMQIAADTGFFGAPVEAFLDDRRFMQDAFVAYYTDFEPEHLWIAEAGGEVVGYLSGSTGSAHASRRKARAAATAGFRLLTFRYRVGRISRRYFGRLAGAILRGEYPHADLKEYPAELHINLTAGARGLGLGKSLMNACLDQMTSAGVPGIHLNTTSLNAVAVRMYEKMGFQLLARKRTRLWEPWLPGQQVDNLIFGKRLAAGSGIPKTPGVEASAGLQRGGGSQETG